MTLSENTSIPARLLVTGSRDWDNREITVLALRAAQTLIAPEMGRLAVTHGGARGLDQMVGTVATDDLGLDVTVRPAQWNVHTESCPDWDRQRSGCALAGFRRNQQMIDEGAALCIAFPLHQRGTSGKSVSKGTWHCADAARNAGIPTLVLWHDRLYPHGEAGALLMRQKASLSTFGHMGQLDLADLIPPF